MEVGDASWNQAGNQEKIGSYLLKRKWQRGVGYVNTEDDDLNIPSRAVIHMPAIKFSLKLEKVMEDEESADGTPSTIQSI